MTLTDKQLFLIGYVAVPVLLIAGLILYTKKTKNGGADERQEMWQNKAGTCSFFALIFSNFISYGAIRFLGLTFHTEVLFLLSMMIGLSVYCVISIWTDSFLTKIENKQKLIGVTLILCLLIIKQFIAVKARCNVENIIILVSESTPVLTAGLTFAVKAIASKSSKSSGEE